MNNKKSFSFKSLVTIAILAVIVLNFTNILGHISGFIGILSPIILGCIIAFILNIIVTAIEIRFLDKFNNRIIKKTKRGLAIVLAFVVVFSLFFFIMKLIIPQVSKSISTFAGQLPAIFDIIKDEIIKILPSAHDKLSNSNFNAQEIAKNIFNTISSWAGGIFSIVNSVFGMVAYAVMASILAIYIVSSKETLLRQFNKLFKKFLPTKVTIPLYHFLEIANDTFRAFFTGQFIEAIILGVLCTIGMKILKLPYASMIGSFVGLTALVPMVGAYLGTVFGFLMILPVAPIKSLIFIIFLLILQQIEGNVIYPRVVGSSVGLPGIWVLISVIIGGGLFGIIGIFFGVPVTAVIYKILKEQVNSKSNKIANRVENIIDELTDDSLK